MSLLGWIFVVSFFLLAAMVLNIVWRRKSQLDFVSRWTLVGVAVICVFGILAVLGAEKQAKTSVEAFWSQDQEVTIRFFRAGTYEVHFSATNGEEGRVPNDFTLSANSGLKIKWSNMPDVFRVSVTKNGKEEYCQDFRKGE